MNIQLDTELLTRCFGETLKNGQPLVSICEPQPFYISQLLHYLHNQQLQPKMWMYVNTHETTRLCLFFFLSVSLHIRRHTTVVHQKYASLLVILIMYHMLKVFIRPLPSFYTVQCLSEDDSSAEVIDFNRACQQSDNFHFSLPFLPSLHYILCMDVAYRLKWCTEAQSIFTHTNTHP